MNKLGSSYGILHANSGRQYCGYLGTYADITQAEIAAIHICALEIANENISQNPIEIFSDSQGALKALAGYKIESKLVIECVQALTAIANTREVTLIWTRGHSTNTSNISADALAKVGASTVIQGPEPFLGLKDKFCRSICESWAQNSMNENPVDILRNLSKNHMVA